MFKNRIKYNLIITKHKIATNVTNFFQTDVDFFKIYCNFAMSRINAQESTLRQRHHEGSAKLTLIVNLTSAREPLGKKRKKQNKHLINQ